MPSVSNNIGKILPSPVMATILLPPPLSTITGTLPVPCPALKTSLFLIVVSLSTPAAVNVSCFPPPLYVSSAPVSMCSFSPLLYTMSLLVCHCFRWMTLNALQIAGTHGCFAPFSVQCGSAQYLSLEGRLFQQVECDVSRCNPDTLVFEDESEKGSNALLARAWSPGWSNADKALTTFLNGPLIEYSKNRRKADSATTSFLSPHLHFGEVSVRKVFHLVRIKQVLWANEGNKAGEESVNLFLKSIGLREYSRYMSFNHPYSHERPLLGYFKYFPWVVDEGYFKAWRQGRTGYPLVDAGMRELWATGWLHDRIRVVVSSFFVKVLQLPWRWGMKYFWDTLLDADLESDALGWQYITGTIPDGRAFDRLDNLQIEGYKFDPNGEYVRRWLPELSRLPTEWIHHPWNAPESMLQAAGIELGSNYPLPIVKIDAAKARLEEALAQMWQQEGASQTAIENGMEEGLGDSSESTPIAFPPDTDMEMDNEPIRNNPPNAVIRRYGDQMVPSMTSSFIRVADEETSVDLRSTGDDNRAEVPSNVNPAEEPRRERRGQAIIQTGRTNDGFLQSNFARGRRNSEDSTAESSSTTRRERDSGIVPVWSPSNSTYSDPFRGEDNSISSSSSYLARHPQAHQLF
ncbi:hypothetical protein SASPL_115526 [Salvia splendens]|uniref:Deoxyribodipyrimidine photo-lyase n=1 Tax=Salvia splendens TaxID=180675 RepID=A0A8X9A0D4_SALSN|nr:hypothetical protein SASPL_115526 [Salvia splendens]